MLSEKAKKIIFKSLLQRLSIRSQEQISCADKVNGMLIPKYEWKDEFYRASQEIEDINQTIKELNELCKEE
jgi:hypothetical protein